MEDTLPQNSSTQFTPEAQATPVVASNSNTLKMVIIGLLIFLPVVGVGAYYLGKQNVPTLQVAESSSNSSSLTSTPVAETDGDNQVACTMDAKICPDGSSVGRTGPNCEFIECPGLTDGKSPTETWQRQNYSADGQVVWSIFQPAETIANQAGLSSGHLSINAKENEAELQAEFSFPIFESGMPETLDKWADSFVENLGPAFMVKNVSDFKHTQNVGTKIISTISVADGIEDTQMLEYFVLIWKHQDKTGKVVNPSLVTVKPVSNPRLESARVEAFTKKLVGGIQF